MSKATGFDDAIQRGVQANADIIIQREQMNDTFREAADSVSKYLGRRVEFRALRRAICLSDGAEPQNVCDFEEADFGGFPVRLSYAKTVAVAHDSDAFRAAFISLIASPHFGGILLKIKGP